MIKTSCEGSGFPDPMCWFRAGGDLARPNWIHECADRALMRPERPPKRLPHSPDLATCKHADRVKLVSRPSSRSAQTSKSP